MINLYTIYVSYYYAALITIVMTYDVYILSVDFADAPITCVIDAIFLNTRYGSFFTEQNSACTACF